METQQVDAHVSLLSRMNAFYGIPNLSQETTAAVEQGAPAPEVYSPEEAQLPQATENTNGEITSPAESFFTEATEQVEISNQAVALQQQAQAVNELSQTDSAAATTSATEETQPETAATTPAAGSNNESAAASSLNTERPVPLDNSSAAAQPASGYNDQSGQVNPTVAAGDSYSSNAVQPGALFSALG